jgi:RHS repeat-associated protein
VSHGYTGHEHEDELGLVNMGGRIYAPRLRRFLTADPIVAVPFGQGLNAYSYVMGDPMNLVDPTGWVPEPSGASGEERAINEDAPDDELPSYGVRAVVPGPTSGDGPAHERPGAGAAGQASAGGQGGFGEVLADVRTQMHASGSPERWLADQVDPGRRARSFLNERGLELVEVVGRVAQATGIVLASMIPLAGEAMDTAVILDDDASVGDRLLSAISLGVNAATVGLLPNASALHRAASITRGAATSTRASSHALAQALRLAGHARPTGTAAHHIVAGGAGAAAPARAVLRRFGISINDAANGVFLPATRASPNPTGAAVHSTLHTNDYYRTVNAMLGAATTRVEAEAALGEIRAALVSGGL